MRSSQWFLIGIFLIALSYWFIQVDMAYSCNVLDNPSTLSKVDIYECINSEILDPFIWLLYPLGFVFIVCGVIEWIGSRIERKEKYEPSKKKQR